MPEVIAPSLPPRAALLLALALAACSSAATRTPDEAIERGTALPPPGMEAPPAARR